MDEKGAVTDENAGTNKQQGIIIRIFTQNSRRKWQILQKAMGVNIAEIR